MIAFYCSRSSENLFKIGARAVAAALDTVATRSSQNLKNMGRNSEYTIRRSNSVANLPKFLASISFVRQSAPASLNVYVMCAIYCSRLPSGTSASRTWRFFMMPMRTSGLLCRKKRSAIPSRSLSVSSGPRILAISWSEQERVLYVCRSLTLVSLLYKARNLCHSSLPVTQTKAGKLKLA